jgi:virulence-associated protein VagC
MSYTARMQRRPRRHRSSGRVIPGRAKIFWTGRSQALRLPKEFRFVTREVLIHREGRRVVLEPCEVERDAKGWPTAWWQLAGAAPEFDVGDRTDTHERGDVLHGR